MFYKSLLFFLLFAALTKFNDLSSNSLTHVFCVWGPGGGTWSSLLNLSIEFSSSVTVFFSFKISVWVACLVVDSFYFFVELSILFLHCFPNFI